MDLIYLKSKDALQNGRFPVERLWISNKRSEEHTSELQSQSNLVCRLLLEKKHEAVEALPGGLPGLRADAAPGDPHVTFLTHVRADLFPVGPGAVSTSRPPEHAWPRSPTPA